MTTNIPTRAAIAAAEPLDFPDRRPARQELTITVHCRVNGFDTELCFSGQVEQLDAITKRLASLGAEPAATAPISTMVEKPRKAAQRVQPAYNDAGEACCPVHNRALKEGKWGLFCSAKDQESGEYCRLKFTE